MTDLTTVTANRSVARFDPAQTVVRLDALKSATKLAKRIKDWEALKEAIDAIIAEQKDYLAWWRTHVTPIKGGDRRSENQSHRPGTLIPAAKATKETGVRKQQVSKWSISLEDEAAYRDRLWLSAYNPMWSLKTSQLVQQSESNEHYTPKQYIKAARTVLGAIDLDPASCAEANRTVRATSFFDEHDNGLEKKWRGRIWLNPPYGDLVGAFIEKLNVELESGDVSAAIVLVNAHCTDTRWFQRLWDGRLCFTDHRVNFYGDDDRSGSTHGSVFAYFGNKKDLFARTFKQFGPVVQRVGR